MLAQAAQRSAILEFLQRREDAIAAQLSELVALPTENPPGANYPACVDLLESQLALLGFASQRIITGDPSVSPDAAAECLLSTFGEGSRTLYFHGHYDVVPAQSREQFIPSRKGHSLFGRGSADMKGGIVAMIQALCAVRESGAALGGKIALLLVPDEETGGHRGMASLARQGFFSPDAVGMLLPEPTSGIVWNANRGAISLRVRVHGKPAHVGLQHQGENAFERMHVVVERLLQLKREVEQRATRFNAGSPAAQRSILMLGGESSGGNNFNLVPAECSFTIDRRINPEEDLATEKSRILAVLDSCKSDGIPLSWEVFQEGPSASCAENAPLGLALSESVQAVTGELPRFELCPGLLETRFYAAQGLPAYAFGPGLLSVAHGPNEYVDLRKIIACAAIFSLAASHVLKP